MSKNDRRDELKATVEKALEVRMQGNDKFKAGDLKGALREYHTVLLSLRGLDSSIPEALGGAQRSINPPGDGASQSDLSPEAAAQHDLTTKIKNAILLTHINMAAIHVKNENWKRALECAKEARKLEESNPKAKFREAQAKIGLGEISTGKKMLEELNKPMPDAAITNALKQLVEDEKARSAKSADQFRGMFDKEKKKKAPVGSTGTSASTSS